MDRFWDGTYSTHASIHTTVVHIQVYTHTPKEQRPLSDDFADAISVQTAQLICLNHRAIGAVNRRWIPSADR